MSATEEKILKDINKQIENISKICGKFATTTTTTTV